ncbi:MULTISPECIES: carbon-nitrogen hydrolase family protein [Streptacidiphilus]|uniref:Carbon-nitrogen hydrolase family protein n=1 Tax=Streptacidiphilus cavernicola TaxID=3342716 RepID=A0ABV6UK78_9ACTN|nr:carbon-nitrogen hydrolase family protein [Streptacidiphilus jeojiense]
MTARHNLKRQVRARATRTGESYTAALRHFLPPTLPETPPIAEAAARSTGAVRLAVAQTPAREDSRDIDALRESGRQVRDLMRQARDQGARIVQFPEGAICFPSKRIMSATGPDPVGPADWDRYPWLVAQAELSKIADLAAELRLWAVVAAPHRLTSPNRPHNSLYVLSDRGAVVTRYDERRLSRTKAMYMYSPGRSPVTFDLDGVRFGCLLGMEIHYPELFAEYEALDVDCVLLSTTGVQPGNVGAQTQGHAASNSFWVSLAVPTQHAGTEPSAVAAPNGRWHQQCPADGSPAVVVVDLDNGCEPAAEAVNHARPWRRQARTAGSGDRCPADPRSENRAAGFN